jgi:hypothetical protein
MKTKLQEKLKLEAINMTGLIAVKPVLQRDVCSVPCALDLRFITLEQDGKFLEINNHRSK